MDEIQLVLVDLDNIRDKVPLDQLWFTERTDAIDPAAPPCVVVFAMNLQTADHHVTSASLGALADDIAARIADAPALGFEVALTLIAKEAADVALERLFAESPLPAHAGRLAAVHLLSRDLGLRASIGAKLPSKSYLHQHVDLTSSWRHSGKKKPVPRRAGKRGLLGLGGGEPEHPHLSVCTREHVANLARRPVDVAKGAALHEIAGLASHRPGLLTQLGLTTQSTRGVERMHEILSGGHPTLGPLEPSDGLELCADVPRPGDYAEPSPSSLGPGAVRFESPPGTLGTALPTPVVLAARGPWPADRGRLQDSALLALVDPQRLHGELVKVRLSVVDRELVAEARRSFGHSLTAWWWNADGPDSKPRLPRSDLSIKGSFTVPAWCAVEPKPGDVHLRAPFPGSVTATVERTTESLVPGSVEGTPVACLLPPNTPPGDVRLAPLQTMSPVLFKRRFPQYRQHFHHLRRLPLLVPA